MEVSFALSYKEGNEIRVSLSSFTEAAIPDLIGDLGDCEIVEISLIRQSGDETADSDIDPRWAGLMKLKQTKSIQ